MNPEKWTEIKGQIKDDFGVLEEKKEALDNDQPGEKEVILFNGPLGRMKLEFITRPVILDKRALASKRIGSERKVQYIYSDSEFSHVLKAYKWDENQSEWLAMEASETFKS
jgi:hypothetical protein